VRRKVKRQPLYSIMYDIRMRTGRRKQQNTNDTNKRETQERGGQGRGRGARLYPRDTIFNKREKKAEVEGDRIVARSMSECVGGEVC
jgi:hypothetical protein